MRRRCTCHPPSSRLWELLIVLGGVGNRLCLGFDCFVSIENLDCHVGDIFEEWRIDFVLIDFVAREWDIDCVWG